MIIYPSIDSLLQKINSKYTICTVAAKRAHDLHENQNPMLDEYKSPKYVGQALEEIDAGVLVVDPASVDQENSADH